MQNGGGHFGQLRGPDHGGSDCWRCGGAAPGGGRRFGGDTSRGSPLRAGGEARRRQLLARAAVAAATAHLDRHGGGAEILLGSGGISVAITPELCRHGELCSPPTCACLFFSSCGCLAPPSSSSLAWDAGCPDARRGKLVVEIAPRRRRRELAWRRAEETRGSACSGPVQESPWFGRRPTPAASPRSPSRSGARERSSSSRPRSRPPRFTMARRGAELRNSFALSISNTLPRYGQPSKRWAPRSASPVRYSLGFKSNTPRPWDAPASARRAETPGAGLLRRARRRAQPLVVEHDVERARPQRRRRHALRARPPLRLLPLGDAAQRPALFDEAPEQGRRPRPLRPPLRRVALRRRPPRPGAPRPTSRPPNARAHRCPLPPHSRTRCARARRCTARPPTALPSVGERRNLF